MKQLYCTSRVASRNIFAFLIFETKRPFFQRLQPLHSSDFCQFTKWSHFSNISCSLELLFAWNNFIVLLESLSVFFLQF